MPHLLWFLAGVAASLAAMLLFVRARRRREPSAPPTDSARCAPPAQLPAVGVHGHVASHGHVGSQGHVALTGDERAELLLARRILDEMVSDLDGLASGLGSEIASLATSIEGHARYLLEAQQAGSGGMRSTADNLRFGLRRLRSFSEKFLCFARVEDLSFERIDARTMLESVAREIDALGARLRVVIEVAEFLPAIRADNVALRNALLFLAETLLRLERRATRVTLTARAEVHEESATRVEVEISVEADEVAKDGEPSDATVRTIHLGYVAARNLLEAMDGRLAFNEVAGLSLTCFVSLLAHDSAALEPVPAYPRHEAVAVPRGPLALPAPHGWGGVLILEGDPQVREMLAHELRPTSRKIVSCVDGAAARSLIEATPERFEVAILAEDSRVEGLDAIAALAAERIQGVRILVLGSARALRPGLLPPTTEVRALRKPFGVDELRQALSELLGTTQDVEPRA